MVNLDEIRIRKEDEIKRIIRESPLRKDIGPVAAERCVKDPETDSLLDLEKNGLRLTRSSHAPLFSILDDVDSHLGIKGVELHLFKSHDDLFENAAITANNQIVVIDFVNNILSLPNNDDEVRTAIGHELGHYAFGHVQDPVMARSWCSSSLD